MSDDEVNKIIAEFMGYKFIDGYWWERVVAHCGEGIYTEFDREISTIYYTKSLDALVPAWDKLEIEFDFMLRGSFAKNNFRIHKEMKSLSGINMPTIQQAAAHATAKAILELNDD